MDSIKFFPQIPLPILETFAGVIYYSTLTCHVTPAGGPSNAVLPKHSYDVSKETLKNGWQHEIRVAGGWH